jgi:hypothetical protein
MEPLLHLTPAETLIVLPCSGTKVPGGAPAHGPTITALLPGSLAAELTQARHRVAATAHLTTDQLRPASHRFAGTFYAAAHDALADATARGAHILRLREGVGFAPRLGQALIDQADHAPLDETPRFVGHRRTIDAGLLAALRDPLPEQDDGANDLVVVLNRIREQ